MSMFRSRLPGVSSKALAHNNVMQGLVGNKELRELQELITAEKAVITSIQRLAADISKASECMKAWGQGEGDDLGDVFMQSNILLQHFCASLSQYAQHEETIRTYMKAVRTREENLDEMRRRRRGVAIKLDGAEKKLSRMGEENRHLEAQKSLLQQLREEIAALDRDITIEEAAMSDYKRTTSKDWSLLKFGGLLEVAQKSVQIGQAGKALIEEIPLQITTPGYARVQYSGHQRTETVTSHCSRAIDQITFQPTTSVAYHHPAPGLPPHQPQLQGDPNYAPPQSHPNGSAGLHPPGDPWAQPQRPPATNTPPGYGGLPPGPTPTTMPATQHPAHAATYGGSVSSPSNEDAYGEFGQFLNEPSHPTQSQTLGATPAGGSAFNPRPANAQDVAPPIADPNRFGTFPRSGAPPTSNGAIGSHQRDAAGALSLDPTFNRLENNASPPSPVPPPKDSSYSTTQSGFSLPPTAVGENPWSSTATPAGPAPAAPSAPVNPENTLAVNNNAQPQPNRQSTSSMSDSSSMVLAYYAGDGSAPTSATLPDANKVGGSPGRPTGPRGNITSSSSGATGDGMYGPIQTSPTSASFKPQEPAPGMERQLSYQRNPESVREADAAAAKEIGRELELLTGIPSTSSTANPPPRTSSRQPRQGTLPVYTPYSDLQSQPAASGSSPAPYQLPEFSAPPSLSLSFSSSEPFSADFSSIQASPVTARPTASTPLASSQNQQFQQGQQLQQSQPWRLPTAEFHPKPVSASEASVISQSPPRTAIPTATFDPNIVPMREATMVSSPQPSPGLTISSEPERRLTPRASSASLASASGASGESVLPPPPKLPIATMSSNTARTSSSMPSSPTGSEGPRTISAAAFRRRATPNTAAIPATDDALDAGNTAGVGLGSTGVAPLQVRKKPPPSAAPPMSTNPSFSSATSGYGSTPYASAPTTPSQERLAGEALPGQPGYQPSPLALPGNQQMYESSSEQSHETRSMQHSSPPPQAGAPNPQVLIPPYSPQHQQGPGYFSQQPVSRGGSPYQGSPGQQYAGEPVGVAVGSPSVGYDEFNPYMHPNPNVHRQTIGDHGWKPMGYQQYRQAVDGSPHDQNFPPHQQQQQQQGGRGYESGRFATHLE